MSRWRLIDSELENKQRLYFPHFSAGEVPTDPEQNRRFRQRFFYTSDRMEQKAIRKRCAEDLLFYASAFVYIYDAGDESGKPGPVPFIPYDYQVEALTKMWWCMHDARRPLRSKKPRRMGLSWLATIIFEHCWHFMSNRHLLVGSHREEEVDGTMAIGKLSAEVGEWSKLMPKFDYIHLNLPPWMLPSGYTPRTEPFRSRMKLVNPEKGNIIWGTSASAAAAHGERGWAAWWDEASRTENLYDIIGGLQAFAPCKFWISTIGNLDHPFSTILKEAPGVEQLDLEWYMHPDYAKDLTINPETGVRSSPWLARKLSEINNDRIKANELYFADESVQVGGYYSPDTFLKMQGTADKPGTVMIPRHVGELDVIEAKDGPFVSRFCEQPNGRWMFWLEYDATGRPSRADRYILGIDTAAGTTDSDGRGASNSVIAVCSWLTGEIVAEFVTHGVKPYELAAIACAAGKWFEGDDFMPAFIVAESNGPGAELNETLVKKYRYPNVFTEVGTWSKAGAAPKYGWHKVGGEQARLAFGLHQQMICEGVFKERSAACVREMRHYQNNPNGVGAPIHSASLMSVDPSGARDNHGDRVVSRVCICQALKKPYESQKLKGMAPWGSYRSLKDDEKRKSWEDALV